MGNIVVNKETNGEVFILRPCGYIDERGGAALLEVAEEAISKGFLKIIINFAESPVINSQGIAQIIELAEIIVDEKGGDLAFCDLSELASSVFKMVGLLQMANSYKNEKEALTNLAN